MIGKNFKCPRELPIIIVPHHFFHLVKLQKGAETRFTVEVEEPLVQATIDGLGEYSIDADRAERLSWIPEILEEPHEIWEPSEKKTADEFFLREYDKPGTPFRAVLLKQEQGFLKIVTCMPMPRNTVKNLRDGGRKLWPKK